MKVASLFSGGEGFGCGVRAAGLDHVWGIEYDNKIAQVARDNGFRVITADVLNVNPATVPSVDWLHASPPCPSFSNAKTNAEETDLDRALAAKVAGFIRVILPNIFTLENVYQYRNSQSYETIATALLLHGYRFNYWHVNMADYGVPQTRQRMIVIARRDGRTPQLPPATHTEKPKADLFGGGLKRWVGWYEAIEDLIPTLQNSQFAPWQLKRLPGELVTGLIMSGNSNFADASPGKGFHKANEPTHTVTARLTGGWTRAFIECQHTIRDAATIRAEMEPATAISVQSASRPSHHRIIANGRIVQMTPRALARFQSFPNWYKLPANYPLACRIIGNAIPPLFVQRLAEWIMK